MALFKKTPKKELKALYFTSDPVIHEKNLERIDRQRSSFLSAHGKMDSGKVSGLYVLKLKRTFDIKNADPSSLYKNKEEVKIHINEFFEAKKEQENLRYYSNLNRIQELVKSHDLQVAYDKIKDNKFNKFLLAYNRGYEKHFYITGTLTAVASYVGGDMVARAITGRPLDFHILAALSAASFYYGWENPFTNKVLDAAIPIERRAESEKVEAVRKKLAESVSAETKTQSNIGPVEKELRKWGRVGAFFALVSPIWTTRHVMLMQLAGGMSSAAVFSMNTVANSLKLWAGSTLAILGFERVIQGEIPLHYRYLTQATVSFAWQIAASIVATMK